MLDPYGNPEYEKDEFGKPIIRSEEQQKLLEEIEEFKRFKGLFGPTSETEAEGYGNGNYGNGNSNYNY